MATSLKHLSDRTSDTAVSSQARGGRTRLWAKIALIVATPVLACFLAFQLAASEWFRHHADPQWIQSSDRVYTAREVPCEVVVYGDSTAITGLDPKIIQARTGLRTCNIAQTKAVIVVAGMSGLDIFLHRNPRPRYLLLQFAAADFYTPHNWQDTNSYMEGVISLLRYFPRRTFVAALAQHPEIFMGIMHYTYLTGPLSLWRNRKLHNAAASENSLVDVHFVLPEPPNLNCSTVTDIDQVFHAPDPAFIGRLRAKYAGLADHLLINVAPLSVCDDRYELIRRVLHGTDNAPQQYPAVLFNQGYTHYTADGAQRLSEEVAQQIQRENAAAPATTKAVASAAGRD